MTNLPGRGDLLPNQADPSPVPAGTTYRRNVVATVETGNADDDVVVRDSDIATGFRMVSPAALAALIGPAALGLGVKIPILSGRAQFSAAAVNQAQYVSEAGGVSYVASTAGTAVFYFDPADYAVTGRTTKLKLRQALIANATAAGAVDFTASLRPVTAYAGAAGAISVTLGADVTGSAVVTTAPAAGATALGATADFTVPAAGFYVLRVNNEAAMAASSVVVSRLRLSVHHV